MDIFTLVGLIGGLGLIFGAILMKTSIAAFIDPASAMIVIGGTLASTFVSFSGKCIFTALKDMVTTFFKHKVDYIVTIDDLTKMAEIALREGLLRLEKMKVQSKFLERGVILLSSGLSADTISKTMSIEMKAQYDRELKSQTVLEKMGDMSPAWGMVGTLIGLVIMMLNLNDPSSIGPAMAVALLTTFYGAVLSNLLFLPSATKIEQRSKRALLQHEIIIEGLISIANKENPRMIKEKLMGYLTR
jgi:chemotaxis protein MotA